MDLRFGTSADVSWLVGDENYLRPKKAKQGLGWAQGWQRDAGVIGAGSWRVHKVPSWK